MRNDATVLVLDDDRDFARTLKSVLEAKGYPALVAHDGGSALRVARHEEVAVAVIDLKLDDMPGIEVLRKIRRHAPSIECILLTGFASQELAIEAVNLGGFGFLKKPCDLDQLLVMIRRAIEKRDAREALRESERHTRAILHSSLDAVVTLDETGRVIDWNPQAERTLGWTRREALGHELFELVFESGDEAMRRAWGAPSEIALVGRPVEARLRHKDGHDVEVEWVVTTVEMAQRRTFTFFIKDVTRRKRLEEHFLQAQRTEAVALLAGGVLHDFSNVLTAIMGQSALLREDPQLLPENRQSAQEILEAAQRASGLARQLLNYSRPRVREPAQLDLNQVIVDMSRLLKRVLGEHVDLRTQLDAELAAVELDRSEAEQLILNLILNARSALPEGGVLNVETANEPSGRHVRLVVRDHGVGMDSTTLIRAFEPFFTTRELGQGAGLGLSTVKKIVDDNGGEIHLESQPGEGTTCRILFPVCEPLEDTAGAPRGEAAPGGSETVLVVEDDSLVRTTLVRVLNRYGYQVLDAGSGSEALQLAGEHQGRIEILITDVIMPLMSGSELARHFGEKRPEARVLFISGYSDNESVRSGLGREHQLLPKPFAARDLLLRVRQVLDT